MGIFWSRAFRVGEQLVQRPGGRLGWFVKEPQKGEEWAVGQVVQALEVAVRTWLYSEVGCSRLWDTDMNLEVSEWPAKGVLPGVREGREGQA